MSSVVFWGGVAFFMDGVIREKNNSISHDGKYTTETNRDKRVQRVHGVGHT